jgi:osmotically-inducible protein OsmY
MPMRGRPDRWTTTVAAAVLSPALLVLPLIATGCGGFRPYRRMAQAAASEENVGAQVSDQRLKTSLREALLTTDSSAVLHVTPYVYMGHGYLVGLVSSDAQRQSLIAAAQGVAGLRSLDTYLPNQAADSPTASDFALKGQVKAALALGLNRVTQIEIEVLAGQVVLLGVVSDQSAIDSAASAAQGVSGVTGVTNFLLLPEAQYEKALRPLGNL